MATARHQIFGDLLRRYRTEAGLTQGALADRAGVSQRTVSDLERGLYLRPHRNTVQLLADALGLAPEDRASLVAAAGRSDRGPEVLVSHPSRVERSNNLPDQPTPFIGREREAEAVAALLRRADVRLLTLTGTGGTGKTRLALHVAGQVSDEYPDGVHFVALASISDPRDVAPTLARALGVQEGGGQDLVRALVRHLEAKRALLLLDNFEHLLEAAPLAAELLAACPNLEILTTSREVLHLSGEYCFAVPPLHVPHAVRVMSAETAARYDAVALFVERARASRADFALTGENAPAVVEICRRLDGLPLAIELAAARIRHLPPPALLRRLSSRLKLLGGVTRDVPRRHQTLEAAIDWSYHLLTASEQELFARLAVFAGGCALEAAEAVCTTDGDLGLDILEGVASLVDKSLLLQEEGSDGEPRFRMLETLREYATGRLDASGEGETVRRLHAAYYLKLVQEAEQELKGAGQARWMRRLETEADNIRAALRWSLDRGEAQMAARYCWALWLFWWIHGHLREGQRWLEETAAQGSALTAADRVRTLFAAGVMLYVQGNLARVHALSNDVLDALGEVDNAADRALILFGLGYVAVSQREYREAERLMAQSLELYRTVGDRWGTAVALGGLGRVAMSQGELERATELLTKCLMMFSETEDTWNIAGTLHALGMTALLQGELDQASLLLQQSAVLSQELSNLPTLADCLDGLGGVAVMQGQGGRAARLFGAAQALRESTGGVPMTPVERSLYEAHLAAGRKQVDETQWTTLWAEGRSMSAEQAIEYALSEDGAL